MMTYNTTKVQDNFWLTSPDANLTWIIEGGDWTPELAQLLASCLDRMTYFGRAESITAARLITAPADNLLPNCVLTDRRSNSAVPVLCWSPDVTLAQVLLTSDEAKTNPPPGAIWRYADRPQRTPTKPRPVTIHRLRSPIHFIQFALGSHVAPLYTDAVRITERFRTRMLGRFVERLSGQRIKGNAWSNATPEIKAQGALLSGKHADGTPLEGHRHPYLLLHGEPDRPTRLCIWRAEPFTGDEQAAILSAASHPLELSYKNDPWTITLVPLDQMVLRPPGFGKQASTRWRTLTPWVPPCHALDKKGRPKPGQSLEEQLQRELSQHAVSLAEPAVIERVGWVKSHQPTSSRRDSGPTNTSKLGYNVSLSLTAPYKEPLILGHSSHFGLGLFVPADPSS
jgi:CRISPR-associated protein Csb2